MQFVTVVALSLASLSFTSANILGSLLGGGGDLIWGGQSQSPSVVNRGIQSASPLNVNALLHNNCSINGNGASGVVNCGVQGGPINMNLLSSNDCHTY